MTHSRIRDLNQDEKPREKLIRLGASGLSDVELLALLIRSGGKDKSALDVAREILKAADGMGNLLTYDIHQLLKHKYINTAKASAIKAGLELANRISRPNTKKSIPITKPEEVYETVKNYFMGQTKESLILISIDSRNKLISKDVISIGSLNETIVSPREIFATALNKNAACIIIVHNHPSDDPTPSREDIVVTERIAKLGKEMNIPLLDHIIVADNKYVSMKQLDIFTTFEKSKMKGGDKK